MLMYLRMLSDDHSFDATNIIKTFKKMVNFTLWEKDSQTFIREEIFAGKKKVKKLLSFFSKLSAASAELRYLYPTPYGHDSSLIRTYSSESMLLGCGIKYQTHHRLRVKLRPLY